MARAAAREGRSAHCLALDPPRSRPTREFSRHRLLESSCTDPRRRLTVPILGRYRRRVSTSHARAAVGRSTNAAIPTRQRPRARVLWGGLTIVSVEDEGDGRNDVRVAHTRPIVAKSLVELPSGQMLPRRRDRAGTRTWRSMGGGRSSALPAARSRPCLPLSPIQGKFGL